MAIDLETEFSGGFQPGEFIPGELQLDGPIAPKLTPEQQAIADKLLMPALLQSKHYNWEGKVRDKLYRIPGWHELHNPDQGIIVDALEASQVLSYPNLFRLDGKTRQPQPLSYRCAMCGADSPPKHHTCYEERRVQRNVYETAVPCNRCGERQTSKGSLDLHMQTRHRSDWEAAERLRQQGGSGGGGSSSEVAALQAQVAQLTGMVQGFMAAQGGASSAPVVPVVQPQESVIAPVIEASKPVDLAKKVKACGCGGNVSIHRKECVLYGATQSTKGGWGATSDDAAKGTEA